MMVNRLCAPSVNELLTNCSIWEVSVDEYYEFVNTIVNSHARGVATTAATAAESEADMALKAIELNEIAKVSTKAYAKNMVEEFAEMIASEDNDIKAAIVEAPEGVSPTAVSQACKKVIEEGGYTETIACKIVNKECVLIDAEFC